MQVSFQQVSTHHPLSMQELIAEAKGGRGERQEILRWPKHWAAGQSVYIFLIIW